MNLVILIVEFVTKADLFHRFNPIEEKRWTRKEKERSAHLTRVLEIIHKQNKNTIDVPPNIWVIPKSASLRSPGRITGCGAGENEWRRRGTALISFY